MMRIVRDGVKHLVLAIFVGGLVACGGGGGSESDPAAALAVSTVQASAVNGSDATISWQTDEPASSSVAYGLDPGYGSGTVTDPGLVLNHSITLTGLSPGTLYHYKVSSVDARGNTASSGDLTFTTAAAGGAVPVAVDDASAAATPEGVSVTTVDVLANDTLVDNAVVSGFDNPSANGGTVAYNGDGTFDYTPAAGFTGSDSFTYTLSDDDGDTSTATVTVTVTAINNALPVAVDDPAAATTPEGVSVTTVNVLANDTLVDNAAVSGFDNPSVSGGTVAHNGNGTFDYTPAAGFTGLDSFTYTLSDVDGDTSTATVTVSVTAVNEGPPVATDDPTAGATDENTAMTTVNVLANDTLVDNAAVSGFDNPSANGGTVAYNGNGTFDYTPAADFNGSDSFGYTLTDDDGDSDSATVTVMVTAVDAGSPVATDDPVAGSTPENTALTTVNVLANDTLVDRAAIAAFDSPSVNGATIAYNGDGTFDYTPAPDFNGSDSFSYTLTDDDGDSDSATVTVMVTLVDAGVPDAVDDPAAATTPEGVAVTTINVLVNDTLVDRATVSTFDNPSVGGGTVAYNGDGSFDYTPAPGFDGSDTFKYTLTDDGGDFDTATVTVTVTAVNSGPPVAVDDPAAATAPQGVATTTVNVLANDTLVDNAAIYADAFDNPSANGGTVAYNGDGTFNYTPAGGHLGPDSFTYTLRDDDDESSTATVTLSVVANAGQVVELANLNGSNGFVLNGVAENDNSGHSVSQAGDVNGDGIDDIIIGARYVDPNGVLDAGASYVVFGSTGGFAPAIELSSLNGTNGFVINGAVPEGRLGNSVSAAGDVNGDGIDDLVIGAPRANPIGNQRGSVYVVFGKTSPFASVLEVSDLNGSNGFVLNGIDNIDQAGYSVSGAGDVNGDGIDDLLIGAFLADPTLGQWAGETYLVFGSNSGFPAAIELSDLNGSNGFVMYGVAAEDRSGHSVSAAGDVNGDGFDDVIIGAYLADFDGRADSGAAYVVFGKGTPFASAFSLSTLNGSNGFELRGVSVGDETGRAVGGGGDVNGDGFDDLIVGAYLADPNGGGSGATYVVFGKATGFASALELSSLTGSDGFTLHGEAADDQSGRWVGNAGDVNGDGFDDIIIGARRADVNGVDAGASYVVYGAATFAANFELSGLNGGNGYRINGAKANDGSGQSVITAGDVNGDGFDDVIIGAFPANPNGPNSGASYVVFGHN